jgi:hypothetical protein
MMSCKCVKVNSQSIEELLELNPIVSQVLSEKQTIVLKNLKSIDAYKIVKQLLNGTKDRYSNKTKFVKNFNQEEINELLQLVINDDNYDWDFNENLPFNPSVQVLLKDENNQFMFLYSKTTSQMSIIDIEGQQVFKIKQPIIDYFDDL